jgi:ABC-type lipoprotein release transport system permease subunit
MGLDSAAEIRHTLAAVTLLPLGIALAAGGVPAWRAAQIDPTKSLRVD